MATFNVEIEIGSPDGQRFERVDALVDSRKLYAFILSSLLNGLGVEPCGTMTFQFANGSQIVRDSSQTWVRLNGEDGVISVIFVEDGAIPILGSFALAMLGLEVDEMNKRLVPIKARL